METKVDLLEIYKELNSCLDKPGFRPLIRSASKIFKAPILFTDNEYQLISLYPAEKIGDFVYDTLLDEGSLPEETIVAFHESYLGKPGTRYEPFYEDTGLVKDCPRIFAEVYDEVRIIGHIAVFYKDKNFQPWHLEVAAFLVNLIRVKINLTNQIPSIQSVSLHDLLDRKSSMEIKARSIAYLTKKDHKSSGLLLVAPLDQIKSQQAFSPIAINYCLHRFPNSTPLVYKDDLVILLTEDINQPNIRATAEKISQYLFQFKILCGAVYPITDLYSLADYYTQARLTAIYRYRDEIINKNFHTPLYYYDQVAPYPLFLYMSNNEELKGFIHPVLNKIRAYDLENNTEFYETLEAYCKNIFQKNETAEALHIHRNTLNYRLNRVEELFQVDLKDYQSLLHLLISFEMAVY